jgi:hypothetical protein
MSVHGGVFFNGFVTEPQGLCVLAEQCGERQNERSFVTIFVSKARINHKGAFDAVYVVSCARSNAPCPARSPAG